MNKQALIFVSRVVQAMATQCGYLRLVCQAAGAPASVLMELSRLQQYASEAADVIEREGK